MKGKDISVGVVSIVVVILLGSVFLGSVNGAVEITEYPKLSTGDYFNYELNATGVIQVMKEEFGEDANIQVELSSANMKVTGTGAVVSGGHTYDCVITTMVMDMKFSMSGSYMGHNYTGNMHMTMTEKTWQTKADSKQVKTESTNHEYMNMTIMGQSTNQESKETTETVYDPPVADYKIPVKVGDTWSTQSSEKMHTIRMQRSEGGPWDKTENNMTEEQTMKYQALSEENLTVKAGTFAVLKIKSGQNGNNSYMYEYVTSKGIPVKMEMYSGNQTEMSAELESYHTAQEGGSSSSSGGGGGIPGFEAAVAIGALSIAGIAYGYRRRH